MTPEQLSQTLFESEGHQIFLSPEAAEEKASAAPSVLREAVEKASDEESWSDIP